MPRLPVLHTYIWGRRGLSCSTTITAHRPSTEMYWSCRRRNTAAYTKACVHHLSLNKQHCNRHIYTRQATTDSYITTRAIRYDFFTSKKHFCKKVCHVLLLTVAALIWLYSQHCHGYTITASPCLPPSSLLHTARLLQKPASVSNAVLSHTDRQRVSTVHITLSHSSDLPAELLKKRI